MGYLVVFEKGKTNYSAYVPDLPGVVATGKTKEECEKLIAEGLRLHLEAMKADGETIPAPVSEAELIYVG